MLCSGMVPEDQPGTTLSFQQESLFNINLDGSEMYKENKRIIGDVSPSGNSQEFRERQK